MTIILLMALQAMQPNTAADKSCNTRPGIFTEFCMRPAYELPGQQLRLNVSSCFEIEQMNLFDKWINQLRKYWRNQFNALEKILSTTKNQAK